MCCIPSHCKFSAQGDDLALHKGAYRKRLHHFWLIGEYIDRWICLRQAVVRTRQHKPIVSTKTGHRAWGQALQSCIFIFHSLVFQTWAQAIKILPRAVWRVETARTRSPMASRKDRHLKFSGRIKRVRKELEINRVAGLRKDTLQLRKDRKPG